MKLSSRLCLTHKRVTQKYRNSTLIKKKKKKNCARIGSDRIGIGDTQIFLDRIGSDLKKWYRCIPIQQQTWGASGRGCGNGASRVLGPGILHFPLSVPFGVQPRPHSFQSILNRGWVRMDELDTCAVPPTWLALSQHSPRACTVVCMSARSQKMSCTRTGCAAVLYF